MLAMQTFTIWRLEPKTLPIQIVIKCWVHPHLAVIHLLISISIAQIQHDKMELKRSFPSNCVSNSRKMHNKFFNERL